jgi:hypothetical protein
MPPLNHNHIYFHNVPIIQHSFKYNYASVIAPSVFICNCVPKIFIPLPFDNHTTYTYIYGHKLFLVYLPALASFQTSFTRFLTNHSFIFETHFTAPDVLVNREARPATGCRRMGHQRHLLSTHLNPVPRDAYRR